MTQLPLELSVLVLDRHVAARGRLIWIDLYMSTVHRERYKREALGPLKKPRAWAQELTFVPNEITDLLILGLLESGFIVLFALAEELFLHEVDACKVRVVSVMSEVKVGE